MHDFPPRTRLGFLLDAELGHVELHPFQASLHFVDGATIVAEFRLEYVDGSGRKHAHDPQARLGPDPVSFHELIGERVADLELAPFRLTLVFRSGRRLTVFSNEGSHEAGSIGRRGELIVF